MTLPPLKLFHYWRSSSSWRVRWALAHKQLPFEPVAVNLLESEQSAPAYKQKSPAGFVPALAVGDRVLTESVAICEYLDEAFPDRPLRPADLLLRARMRQLVELINAGTQPLQNLFVLKKMGDKDAQSAWGRFVVERGLGAFEQLLAQGRAEGTKGPFCLGEQLSMADIFLVPQLYNARRFHVELSPFPLCGAVEQAALATDSGLASHPDRFEPPKP